MKLKLLSLLYIVLSMSLGPSCSTTNTPAETENNYNKLSPFAVSYEKITPNQAAGYDLLIVEPSHYNRFEINALKLTGATVLSYISLGEVSKFRWYYSLLEEQGFLGMNENWDSYYIDLANPESYNLFFDEIIPEIMIREFDGLFLDTVDAVAPYTDKKHLQPEMLKMIRQIRSEYPEAMIIQNAGLFLLGKTADVVDAVLIEDVATHYNFNDESYSIKKPEEYRDKIQTITSHSKKHDIPFLILDFAVENTLRSNAAQRLDTLSYPYFISNIELNNISAGVSGNNY